MKGVNHFHTDPGSCLFFDSDIAQFIRLIYINRTTMAGSNPPNGFVRAMRKVYNPIGFQKGYNFTLCKIPLALTKQSSNSFFQGSSLLEHFSASPLHGYSIFPLAVFSRKAHHPGNGSIFAKATRESASPFTLPQSYRQAFLSSSNSFP